MTKLFLALSLFFVFPAAEACMSPPNTINTVELKTSVKSIFHDGLIVTKTRGDSGARMTILLNKPASGVSVVGPEMGPAGLNPKVLMATVPLDDFNHVLYDTALLGGSNYEVRIFFRDGTQGNYKFKTGPTSRGMGCSPKLEIQN